VVQQIAVIVKKQITMSRESLRSLDIIFITRFNEQQGVVDNGIRDTNVDFIKEIDNIFYTLYMQYMTQADADVFYPLKQGESDRFSV